MEATVQVAADRHIAVRVTCRTSRQAAWPPLKVSSAYLIDVLADCEGDHRRGRSKDRPVRLTETIFAGDRNRLVYELGDLDALYERDE